MKYLDLFRGKYALSSYIKTMDELIDSAKEVVTHLEAMKAAGVELDPKLTSASDDFFVLGTNKVKVAEKFKFVTRKDFLGE